MPHFSNTNGLHFHLNNPFDLQSINSCTSFLKYNLIRNYVQREIMYSHHSSFYKVWKSLLHYWKTSLECATKRKSLTEGPDLSVSFQTWPTIGLFCHFSLPGFRKTLEETLWIFRKIFLITLDPYILSSSSTVEKLNSISHT